MCLSTKREQRLASFLDQRAYRQSGDAREPSRTSSRFLLAHSLRTVTANPLSMRDRAPQFGMYFI